MKKLSALLLAVIMIFAICVPAFAAKYPEPMQQFFVNDFAGCITDEDKREMQQMAEALYEKTKAQVVCVTVESLDGADIVDYGVGLGREWGIGEKDNDTGVLLLLSTGDRQINISVGYGLEGALTDGKTGRILDTYAIPHLKEDDFSTGLRETFTVLVNETSTELGEAVAGYEPVEEKDETSDVVTIFAMLFLVACIVVFILFIRSKKGEFSKYNSGEYNDYDNNHRGGPFIGGFGGGSSSGGFGGGGGGFSGGGGSFGGGGSSRGF